MTPADLDFANALLSIAAGGAAAWWVVFRAPVESLEHPNSLSWTIEQGLFAFLVFLAVRLTAPPYGEGGMLAGIVIGLLALRVWDWRIRIDWPEGQR
jgi:hypothetical protein